ncbi:MAG: efflux RND transporter periplasmic adaptor subunit [Pseudomonadota bacterium]
MLSIVRCCLCAALLIAFGAQGANAQPGRSFEGFIEPSAVVNVSSQVPGILEAISVERGDRIAAGQIIASLHSESETAAVDLAAARMEFGKRKVARNEELSRKKLISVNDKDELETEFRIAELQLREAREKLAIRTIRSPIEGVVVERFLSPGEYVGEDPIVKIVRLTPLFVEVIVPVEFFGKITVGMTADVQPETYTARAYSARVIIVDRVVDAASGTFGVRLELPNPNDALPAGLKCRVVFPIK